jgi:hypothetical protein
MIHQQLVRELPAVASQVPVLYLPTPEPMLGSPHFYAAIWALSRCFLTVSDSVG